MSVYYIIYLLLGTPALNTEMRHRALGAGQIYVKQNTTDAQLTFQEFKDMVSTGGEAFSKLATGFGSGSSDFQWTPITNGRTDRQQKT